MTAAVFEERSEPGRLASALLAAAMHALLFLVLLFGVRWQNRPADTVNIELWEPAPAPVVEAPKPAPVVEPPPQPKPEPVIAKPEIVEQKAPPPKPVPKVEPKPRPEPPKPVAKVEPKPVPKAEPLKPRVDETRRRMREEAAREQASLAADRELKDLAKRGAASIDSRALGTWIGSIQKQIRSRINKDIADVVPGNPEAIFMVTLLPNCEVLNITMLKSSGSKAYDDEVDRAIRRASPLPKPDKAEVFDRQLRLTFRPKDL
jgi:colicin import membrane protein